MPRYVILEHDHPFPHWDLMLEAGQTLRTWRLLEKPTPGRTVPAEDLAEHRKLYLDFEGPLSGERGRVNRIDAGIFTWREDSEDQVVVEMEGGEYRGRLELTRSVDGHWSAHFHAEEGY